MIMPIEFSEETWATFSPKQRESLIFLEQMTGASITDREPPADSPLGRMIAMRHAKEQGRITEDEYRAACRRILEEPLQEDPPSD